MLRKPRSVILHLVSVCGNGAIALLRAVIPRKCSAQKIAACWRSSLSELRSGSRLGGRPTAGTAEQIAVEPSIRSRVRPIACGRNSSSKLSGLRLVRSSPINQFEERARVIQIAQRIASGEKILAVGLAVLSTGRLIPRRLTKNSVALYATTLCARR